MLWIGRATYFLGGQEKASEKYFQDGCDRYHSIACCTAADDIARGIKWEKGAPDRGTPCAQQYVGKSQSCMVIIQMPLHTHSRKRVFVVAPAATTSPISAISEPTTGVVYDRWGGARGRLLFVPILRRHGGRGRGGDLRGHVRLVRCHRHVRLERCRRAWIRTECGGDVPVVDRKPVIL